MRAARDRGRPRPSRDGPFRCESSTAWGYPPFSCTGGGPGNRHAARRERCDGGAASSRGEKETEIFQDGAARVRRGCSAVCGGGGEGTKPTKVKLGRGGV